MTFVIQNSIVRQVPGFFVLGLRHELPAVIIVIVAAIFCIQIVQLLRVLHLTVRMEPFVRDLAKANEASASIPAVRLRNRFECFMDYFAFRIKSKKSFDEKEKGALMFHQCPFFGLNLE